MNVYVELVNATSVCSLDLRYACVAHSLPKQGSDLRAKNAKYICCSGSDQPEVRCIRIAAAASFDSACSCRKIRGHNSGNDACDGKCRTRPGTPRSCPRFRPLSTPLESQRQNPCARPFSVQGQPLKCLYRLGLNEMSHAPLATSNTCSFLHGGE